jgi:hypothetical protein
LKPLPMASFPPLRQRLILVVRAARLQLGRRQVQDALPGPLRDHRHRPQQVLVGIPEPDAPPDAGLKVRGRAGQVEGGHALIRVPDVDHSVRVGVRGLHLERAQETVPVDLERLKGRLHLGRVQIPGDDGTDRPLVDPLRIGRVKLLPRRILVVAQEEDHLPTLPRRQVETDMVGADGGPAVGDGVEGLAPFHRQRAVPAPVRPQEGIPLRVKARQRFGTGEEGEVVAALPVLRLVVDDPVLHLHLAGAEIALEVGGVVPGVPEAELHRREDGEGQGPVALVGHRQLPDFQVRPQRDEVAGLRGDALAGGADNGVAQAVPAEVLFRLVPGRLPGRGPEPAGLVVPQVEVAPAGIGGNVVVAVAGQAAQAGVPVEAVAPGGVGDDTEEVSQPK